MPTPLHVLFVEDSLPDMEEMLYILRRGGFDPQWQRVDEMSALRAALCQQIWDVILCDHQLPGFNSLDVLAAVKQSTSDTPLIIVSGVVEEHTAVIAMKSGASDFLKKDRLSRLSSAIQREMDERSSRQQFRLTKTKLQETEERFRMMIEAARDYAIFMLDPEGRVITWNIGAERMFGYTPQEAIGLPLSALYPHATENPGHSADSALSLATTHGHYEEEGIRVRRDGSTFWVHAVMMPMKGPDGSLQGFSRITRDIDRQKRADEVLIERNNFKNLFEQTSAIIAIASGPEHILEFANPTFSRLLNEDQMGQPLGRLGPLLEIKPLIDKVFADGITEEAKGFELSHSNHKRFFDLIFSAKRNAQGHIDGVMILGSDVTEQLQARMAAEASSASKSAFLANMSHEIRTPLAAILGFSDLLKDNDLSTEDRDRYIDTINRNSQALTQIIDDILDLAKIEANRLDVEEINFSLLDLMHDVIELFKEKVRQKGIELNLIFDALVPDVIGSDPTRLRQILFNIIGNAIKFTDIGSVSVSVRLLQQTEGLLRIAVDVKDTGRGISESQKQKLFQPFTQADNTTTRQFGGTGLGLALSKRLCEALGGSIAISETELAKGSLFTITFLASRVPGADESQTVGRIPKLRDLEELKLKDIRVLVVDDMIDNQILLKRYLTRNGAQVEFASDGSEGVEKALEQTHDLVLMDIQMPKVDGYQAIKMLLAKGYKKPIVALTAHALLEERRRTAAAGFAAHLTKPFNRDELIDTVAQLARGNLDAGSYSNRPVC